MNELGLLIKMTEKDGIVPLLERIKSFNFKTCQISTYVPELYTREVADIINDFCAKNDLRVTMLWAGWPGKCEWNFVGGPDTVGLVPLQYRRERCDIMKKASDFAAMINVDRIATHAGFIPENMKDPLYTGLITDLKDVALHCKANNQFFCFETGQETPVTLLRTIQDIGTDNLGINLDPANLVMYGKGSAVDSLIVLGSYLKGVHVKDGKYPTDGKELGIEVTLGEGHVNMPALLAKLKEIGYTEPLTIEIELDRRTGEMTADEAIRRMVDYLNAHR
ncbi:sugar phosphate isomerase/epimerase family protein [Breznakiella homolactica]|uniref:Sugar phosphate isomerase/epimerase n=1 Tax=Breznakiella homolactica TaxID=2798577 RepID=A0A7T7XPK2_9SPIR|nr:sugar phosphate isomerase/epimerase family protein [Breznakiella homolactica]QQO10169.1 sugar phosphate isomerase/epimerase [Breznakiella homolactica]